MIFWLPLLILPAQSTAPMEHRYAETVFETNFEPSSDANYDGWPDNWTRRRGIGFPQYVTIGIEDAPKDTAERTRCLRFDLDGGGATAYSPPIEISSQFSYTLQGKIKTLGLTHNVAYLSVSFFDRDREQKETFTSKKLTNASQWQELQIGPLTPSNPEASMAVIGLHLIPTNRSDLAGSAMFDDICLARLPNMTIQTTRPNNLFPAPGAPEITCSVSGIQHSDAIVQFELIDVSGHTLLCEQLKLSASDATRDDLSWPGDLTLGAAMFTTADDRDQSGTVTWRPQFPDYGFYHVRASLRSNDRMTLQHTISVAVMRDLDTQREGEFGWSLTRNGHTLSDNELLALLGMVNASWVKYPIWYGPDDDAAEGERIAALADRLSATGIEMVGVFDRPPKQVFKRFGAKEYLSVAEAFLEPDMWQPAIDPLMIRLSLKIQWWQLGADDDESFIDYQGLEQKIREIRSHLKKFGQRIRLGLAWRWIHEPPQTSDPPWDFLAMNEPLPFTNVELATYAKDATFANSNNWVTLWPLPQSEYDYQTRAQDLVLRMTQAKIDGAEAIFAGNPFDPSRGLLHKDGTPGDLLLPWCITSKMLASAEYLGSLQLPNDSPNHVFSVDGEAVMVIWNVTPVTESLYLGDHVVRVDPWGRETVLSNAASLPNAPQQIAVEPLPAFVKGLDLAITHWRLKFAFEPDRLASLFGRRQTLKYGFENTLDHGVGGTLRLHVPDVWDVRAPHLRFKLGAEDYLRQELSVLLHANASSGAQAVQIDFDFFADRQYRFSVFRKVQVGLGDIIADLDTWLDDDGKLIVEQHLMNHTTKTLDFNCYLFVPGRRRMRIQVFDIGPGRVTHTFVLQNGQQLLGKSLWLQIEELGGKRIQNYHVVAEP